MAVGNIIRELREDKSYTQRQLAKMIGISSGCLSKYETGKTLPAPDILIKLADVFNVSVDYLIGKNNLKCDYESLKNDYIKSYTCFDLLNDALSLDPEYRKQLTDFLNLVKFRNDFNKISSNMTVKKSKAVPHE